METIRLSELIGKNVVNIYDGVRFGTIQDADLTFHPESGELETLLIPGRGGFGGLFPERSGLQIPWAAISKIGREVIIVDMGMGQNSSRRR